MAVAYIEYGVSPGATSTTCVIVRPANLAVGNLMIAHVGFASTDTITAPVVTPAWNLIQDRATTDERTATFWKLATLADTTAVDFTFTGGTSARNKGAISTFSGHDSSEPIATSNYQINGVSSICTSAGITPPVANCMIVFCGFAGSGSRTFTTSGPGAWTIATSPPTFTETYDTSDSVSVGMACGVRPETAATGDGTVTMSGVANNVGILIAIYPSATVEYLIVGGGGGGGGSNAPLYTGGDAGGGGGGGEVAFNTSCTVSTGDYTVTVGGGGAGGSGDGLNGQPGSNGDSSSIGGVETAIGGYAGQGN